MSTLVDHARRELDLCGQTAEDPDYATSIINAVEAFSRYGHSGGSAMVAVEQLRALLMFETLSPLTDDPAEWFAVASELIPGDGEALWQSGRNPAAFSSDGGKTFWLTSEGASMVRPEPLHQSATSATRHEVDSADGGDE